MNLKYFAGDSSEFPGTLLNHGSCFTTGALATSDLSAVPSSNPFGSTAASAPTNPTPASTNLFGAPVADSKNVKDFLLIFLLQLNKFYDGFI